MSDSSFLPPEPPSQTPVVSRQPAPTRRVFVVIGVVLAVLTVAVIGLVARLGETSERLASLEDQLNAGRPASAGGESNGAETGTFEESDLYQPPADIEELIDRVGQSVVDIWCGDSGGTGFAFDIAPRGPGAQTVIVTNHHVIDECWEDDTEVTVMYGSSMTTEAAGTIVGADEENDLALIEVAVELPWLIESDLYAKRGWWTMAMGNPLDPDIEVTLNRYVTFGYIGYVLDKYWNYTSATLNRGNSGGPLVNSRGELIGINTLASSGIEEGVWNIAVDSAVLCERLVICEE